MPPRKVRKKTPPAASIDDLALELVLSFLPAQDAVRTCVLARRWEHTWKSVAGLIIQCSGGERSNFVDSLLRARGGTPIDTCEFHLLELDDHGVHRIDLWICHVLQCKVRVLRINDVHSDRQHPYAYWPADLPLISQHLKKLQLQNIEIIYDGILDFSSCPVLEDLEIRGCDLSVGSYGLSSQSLKHLTIDGCQFAKDCRRLKICAPNVVSLLLKVDEGGTPSLEQMPFLVRAVTKINNNDWGHLPNSIRCRDCNSVVCDCYDREDECFLLHSLSEAQSLALIAHDTKYRTKRDLEFYPTFNKLKTLLLNEYWCEPPDFSALASLLEHSPVLEKLTLQLYSEGPKHNVEIKLSCKSMEKSAVISGHLSTVEIKCQALDGRVSSVLKFLGKLNIWFQFSDIEVSA